MQDTADEDTRVFWNNCRKHLEFLREELETAKIDDPAVINIDKTLEELKRVDSDQEKKNWLKIGSQLAKYLQNQAQTVHNRYR